MNPAPRRWLVVTSLWLAAGSAFAQGYSVVNTPSAGPTPVTPTSATPPVAAGPGSIAVMGSSDNTTPSSRVLAGSRRLGPGRVHRPEEYGGVTPGAQLPRGLQRLARVGRTRYPVIAWPGFQIVPSGSRVFVAMAGTPGVTETRGPSSIVYHLTGARIALWNNRRPLLTEGFPTPVNRVYLRPARNGVDLVLELRAPAEPRMSQEPGPSGLTFLNVDFGAYAGADIVSLQLPTGQVDHTIAPGAPVPGAPPALVRPGVDAERPR